jgi:hypothetical protein
MLELPYMRKPHAFWSIEKEPYIKHVPKTNFRNRPLGESEQVLEG